MSLFRRRKTIFDVMAEAQRDMVRTMLGTQPIADGINRKSAIAPSPTRSIFTVIAPRVRELIAGKPTPPCGLEIYWPTVAGTWAVWACPLDKGHKTFHCDENFYPGYHTADVAFFRAQYDLLKEG